jgi:hypothetical protein
VDCSEKVRVEARVDSQVQAVRLDDGGLPREAAPRVGGRTSHAVENQSFRTYRSICIWLGHFYALLIVWRWGFVSPPSLSHALAAEALVAMLLFYGAGLLIRPLTARLGGLENFGLMVVGFALCNNVFLVAWLPGEVQLVNFILVQVCTSVAFRSAWRFGLSQVLCLGLAVFSIGHWVGPQVIAGDLFILLSGLLISSLIWTFLRRLLRTLSDLRMKDRLLLHQRTRLVRDLRKALANVRTLRGLIPICAHCRRVRDDAGFWQQVEAYVHERSEAKFSHGICPECQVTVQAELEELKATWIPERSRGPKKSAEESRRFLVRRGEGR